MRSGFIALRRGGKVRQPTAGVNLAFPRGLFRRGLAVLDDQPSFPLSRLGKNALRCRNEKAAGKTGGGFR
jgi:hypothetical protein